MILERNNRGLECDFIIENNFVTETRNVNYGIFWWSSSGTEPGDKAVNTDHYNIR